MALSELLGDDVCCLLIRYCPLNTLGAEGFFIISVASAGTSTIFIHFRLKN
jgi:hypothetical protein